LTRFVAELKKLFCEHHLLMVTGPDGEEVPKGIRRGKILPMTGSTEFVWDVPHSFNFGRDVIDRLACEQRRGLVSLAADGSRRDYTFPEIVELSQRWAAVLRGAGIGKGDRVLVVMPKVPEWLFAMIALLRLGAVAVPVADQLRSRDVLYRANHSEACALIAHASVIAELEEMRPFANSVAIWLVSGSTQAPNWTEIKPSLATVTPFAGVLTTVDDLACIMYTSGTTKDPKGVVHAVSYTYASRLQAELWLDAKPSDVVWCTASTGWAKALWNVLLGPWWCGSCIVLDRADFNAEERLDRICGLGVTVLCQAPTEYRLLAKLPDLAKRWQLPNLRLCVSAGEPLNAEVIERWRGAFGLTILDGFGQTENSLLVANLPGGTVRPGSMGMPTPGHDVAVIDDEGRICEAGVVGDLALRGDPPSMFRGYFKNDEDTRACRRGEWYLTGDRAQVDDDGYYWFVGRTDDVIKSGAYRIGPFEVESALIEHPAVLESAVVGSPHPDRGNIVKAFVVLRSGFEATPKLIVELQEHCKSVTAPYKYPREIEFVSELPKTNTGKIRRAELRRAELQKKGATAASGLI
jgi:acyl-coenzyme A synthetase/AMP-(fatty) acid ligase